MTDIQIRNEFSKVAIATLFLIDSEDRLKGTKNYRHKIKQLGSSFFKELTNFENELYFNLKQTNATQEEMQEFFEQFVQSAEGLNNILDVQMNFKNDNQREYFNKDLTELIEKYNLINNK